MQYIRKLASSVNKLVYPSGRAQTLGSLKLEPTPKIIDVTGLGYNDNSIFQNDDSNPSKWQMQRGTYTSRTTLKNGKVFGKMVSIQPRWSNDGTIFPPNKNTYLGTAYVNQTVAQKTLQHKLNIIRNATTYSPVQEIVLFQALVNAVRTDFTPDLGIRVNPDIAGDAGNVATYLKPTLRDITPYMPYIVGTNEFRCTALDKDQKKFTSILVDKDGRRITTEDWIEVSYETREHGPKPVANYRRDATAYYSRLSRCFIMIDTVDIDNWSTKLSYIRINSYSDGKAEGGYLLPIDAEFIACCKRAKAKGYEKVALTLVTMTGQLYDGPTANIGRPEYVSASMYRNDLVPDSIVVDPNGDWVRFKLIRPGNYTVWFNNEVYAFDRFSNGDVQIDKQNTPFTAGGTLEITLNGYQDTNFEHKIVYEIPDTIPPNPPTIISYARDAVYGTCDEGDKVFVERDGQIIGRGTGTSTGTYEALVAAGDLENDQVVYVYTQDSAGNKSEKIEGIVKDILSNLKYDLDDTVNAVRSSP